MELNPGVKWVGNQNPWCAPGFTGHALREYGDSVKVWWHERGTYTWERRKNLSFEKHEHDEDSSELVTG